MYAPDMLDTWRRSMTRSFADSVRARTYTRARSPFGPGRPIDCGSYTREGCASLANLSITGSALQAHWRACHHQLLSHRWR
jgi:hypothetical protein